MADLTAQEKSLFEKASQIFTWPQDQLLRPKNAAGLTFDDTKPVFDAIQGFYGQVLQARFNWVPGNYLEEMNRAAEGVLKIFAEVRDFSFQVYDPNAQRNNTAGRVAAQWREAISTTAQFVALGHVTSGAVEQQISAFKGVVNLIAEGAKKAADDYAGKISILEQAHKAQKDELEKVMNAAREAAKFEAVTAQSTAFDNEAREARTASWIWLSATVVVVVVSLWFVWFVFLKDLHPALADPLSVAKVKGTNAPTTATNAISSMSSTEAPAEAKVITAALLQQTIARILVVTLLYSAVVWCARNYFASCHNYIVNRHRRNAMNTFRAFVQGTDDKATQDFILRQAAACAFSPQQSGYLKDESLPTPGPASQIMEMAKPGGKSE
jgi:hypothetical protein